MTNLWCSRLSFGEWNIAKLQLIEWPGWTFKTQRFVWAWLGIPIILWPSHIYKEMPMHGKMILYRIGTKGVDFPPLPVVDDRAAFQWEHISTHTLARQFAYVPISVREGGDISCSVGQERRYISRSRNTKSRHVGKLRKIIWNWGSKDCQLACVHFHSWKPYC